MPLEQFTPGDGNLLFALWETATGREPWYSDGTPGGTGMLKDTRAGSVSGIAYPGENRAYEIPWLSLPGPNLIFYARDDSEWGLPLWRSDGTQAGTAIAEDLHTPGGFTVLGSSILFVANGETVGRELYKIPLAWTPSNPTATKHWMYE